MRIGLVNIGSLRGRDDEILDIAEREGILPSAVSKRLDGEERVKK